MNSGRSTRREFVAAAAMLALDAKLLPAAAPPALPSVRPAARDRRFTSAAVENLIARMQPRIADPALATLFTNCLPNTLDTTVHHAVVDGQPDTYVVTGDIDAMWLRDSSAQVWPYLPLLREDKPLERMIAGLIRRQGRMILLDPYANAFLRDASQPPLPWAVADTTEHIAGVGERKWEIDSLCYPLRLAYGYWKATGETRAADSPFDASWQTAAWKIVETLRVQQRKNGDGPYSFRRSADVPTETLANRGLGNPARPVGLIFSGFRPSDDACTFPLFIPANHFAVVSLRQLAQLATAVYADHALAGESTRLADEVEAALNKFGTVEHPRYGRIWAYEVDGYGNSLMMDDANAPGLLSLAYLGCCGNDDPIYRRTRAFVWSGDNPWFFRGRAAEGIGGPHEGRNYIWPMSIMMRALTATGEAEIAQCLRWLRDTTAGRGLMHESFHRDNAADFTRSWFAWANSLFGELIVKVASEHPRLLASRL
jgi:hypothetical protein